MDPTGDRRVLGTDRPWQDGQTGNGRGPSRTGECLKCGAATREGKPYCPDHVEEMPYVREYLLVQLARRQGDLGRIEATTKVEQIDLTGPTVSEVLRKIATEGRCSADSLKRLGLSEVATRRVVLALMRAKLISASMSKKKTIMVRLRRRRT